MANNRGEEKWQIKKPKSNWKMKTTSSSCIQHDLLQETTMNKFVLPSYSGAFEWLNANYCSFADKVWTFSIRNVAHTQYVTYTIPDDTIAVQFKLTFYDLILKEPLTL